MLVDLVVFIHIYIFTQYVHHVKDMCAYIYIYTLRQIDISIIHKISDSLVQVPGQYADHAHFGGMELPC